jgi:hypothetical protein
MMPRELNLQIPSPPLSKNRLGFQGFLLDFASPQGLQCRRSMEAASVPRDKE